MLIKSVDAWELEVVVLTIRWKRYQLKYSESESLIIPALFTLTPSGSSSAPTGTGTYPLPLTGPSFASVKVQRAHHPRLFPLLLPHRRAVSALSAKDCPYRPAFHPGAPATGQLRTPQPCAARLRAPCCPSWLGVVPGT